jgi:capsular exopolysaccharide synthesis family protein
MLPLSNVLISKLKPASPIAESFRVLRTFIKNRRPKQSEKGSIILVSSAGNQEGKTTVLANMAVSLAQDGIKVLMIDCHLRTPSLHQVFQLVNQKGLTRFLTNGGSIEDFIIPVGVLNLFLLPSGEAADNPSELLSSGTMLELLEDLKLQYDMILLDSPAVLSFTDAQVLASHCDGATLVVKYGKSNRDAVSKARALLESAGGKVLGVVINQTERRRKE